MFRCGGWRSRCGHGAEHPGANGDIDPSFGFDPQVIHHYYVDHIAGVGERTYHHAGDHHARHQPAFTQHRAGPRLSGRSHFPGVPVGADG